MTLNFCSCSPHLRVHVCGESWQACTLFFMHQLSPIPVPYLDGPQGRWHRVCSTSLPEKSGRSQLRKEFLQGTTCSCRRACSPPLLTSAVYTEIFVPRDPVAHTGSRLLIHYFSLSLCEMRL